MSTKASERPSWKMLHRLGVARWEQTADGTFNPDQVTYAVSVSGRLDLDRLAAAWERIQKRHPVLGSRFDVKAERWWLEEPARSTLTVSLLQPGRQGRDDALAELTAALTRPFDLGRGPLARLHAVAVSESEALVGLAVDHLVSDAWSIQVLFAEVWQLFGTPGAQLPPVEVTAGDLVAEEHTWLASPAGLAAIERRLKTLATVSAQPTVQLPGMRLAPVGHEQAHRARFTLPSDDLARLRRLRVLRGLAPATVAHAALAGALHLLGGQESIGTIMALANRSRPSVHRIQGWLADNTIVVTHARNVITTDFVADFGGAVFEALNQSAVPMMAALAHAEPDLIGMPTPGPTAGFNGGVSLAQRFPLPEPAGLALAEVEISAGWGYRALMAHAAESAEGLEVKVSLKRRWFEEAQAAALGEQMQDLLLRWSSSV